LYNETSSTIIIEKVGGCKSQGPQQPSLDFTSSATVMVKVGGRASVRRFEYHIITAKHVITNGDYYFDLYLAHVQSKWGLTVYIKNGILKFKKCPMMRNSLKCVFGSLAD